MFLGYASKKGQALIDRALYLPQSWAADRARRIEAGVPEDAAFITKPKLGRQMLARALAAGVPCAWVTGDSVYGADYALRRWIERQGRGYVLAVTSGQRLGFARVDDWPPICRPPLGIASRRAMAPRGRGSMTGLTCPTRATRPPAGARGS